MKKRLMIVVGWLLLAGSVQANDLAPVALQSVTPDRSWFYNLEEVVFDADESYVPNGYIAWTKWYIDGVYQTQGSYYHNMSVCFALYGSPEGDCYELDQGKTTVQIKLMVQSNYGYWDEQTITYTIKEHKGRKYFVKDHLGSVRTTVNRDGNVLGYDDYYPFGLAMPDRSNNNSNPNADYKFTGHERDDEADIMLDYMMARNYDPIIGRFMQIDPMASKYPSLSPYTYVANNPMNAFDPDGRLIIFINGMHGNGRFGSYPGKYYWNWSSNFDSHVKDHFNDYNAIYRDGSKVGMRAGLNSFFGARPTESNAYDHVRYNAGYDQALEDFDYITAKLAPEETIKIITHSMGSVYGKGYVAALKKLIRESPDPAIRKIKISLVADFDPYQAGGPFGDADPDIFTQQFWHDGGLFGIADQLQRGAEDNEDPKQKKHALRTFLRNIQDLREGTYVWDEKTEQWKCTNCK